MKQLLIAKKSASTPSTPLDLTGGKPGFVGVYALNNPSAWLSAKADTNVAIVYGLGTTEDNVKAFVVPEVDIPTLKATAVDYADGTKFKAEFTVPSTIKDGKDYTVILIKKGTVFNERYQYTVTDFVPKGETKTAIEIATSLADQLKNKLEAMEMPVTVTRSSAKITVEATDFSAWTLALGDGLMSTEVTITDAKPAVGDKAYVQHLASVCAAGKGVNYTDLEGRDLYANYPEIVDEDKYNFVHLRFAVGRDSAKQRDERVFQEVYIAVPNSDSATFSKLKTIFGISSSNTGGATGGAQG